MLSSNHFFDIRVKHKSFPKIFRNQISILTKVGFHSNHQIPNHDLNSALCHLNDCKQRGDDSAYRKAAGQLTNDCTSRDDNTYWVEPGWLSRGCMHKWSLQYFFLLLMTLPWFPFHLQESTQFCSSFLSIADVLFAVLQKKALSLGNGNKPHNEALACQAHVMHVTLRLGDLVKIRKSTRPWQRRRWFYPPSFQTTQKINLACSAIRIEIRCAILPAPTFTPR